MDWAVTFAEQGELETQWRMFSDEARAMTFAEERVVSGHRDVRVWRLKCEAQRAVRFVGEEKS